MIRYRNRRHRFNESITIAQFEDRARRAVDTLKTKPGLTREQTRMQDVGKIEPVPIDGDSLFSLGFVTKNSPNLVCKLDVTSLSSGKHYIINLKLKEFWPRLAEWLAENGLDAEACRQSTASSLDRLVNSFFALPSTQRLLLELKCSCHDFTFRFRRRATEGGSLFMNEDDEEEGPIESPGCKHSAQAIIRKSGWYQRLAYYIARQVLKVMPEEVFKFLR